MSLKSEASGSLRFYTGINYSGTSLSVAHGATGPLATSSDNWTYRSVAMSGMHAFCWSEVNTADTSLNDQNHTESLITTDIADLAASYAASAFPLAYLGVDPEVATPVWLNMSAVTGDMNAVASTSVVGGSTTSITTLSLPGIEGVAGFIGLTAGSSVVATCSYGTYNTDTGQVVWSGLNTGTLVLEYTGGAVTILSATGFPDGWSFAAPAMQTDGSWKITVGGGAASGNVISNLMSDKSSISNDGQSTAVLTATVTDSSGLPVANVSVNWSAVPGDLSAASSVTDASGQATVALTDTGDTGSSVVSAALDNGSTKSVSVTLTDGSADDVTLVSVTSDKDTLDNDGTDQAKLTATVQDADGNVVEGIAVTWATNLGTLNHSEQDTDSSGQSHAKFTDSGDTGVAKITASLADGTFMNVKITVEDSGAGNQIVSLTSDKSSITNDGTDAAVLTATVVDRTGAAAAGVTVNWSTTLGSLSTEASVTDTAGQATASLTDSGDTGSATVTAALENGSTASNEIAVGSSFVSGAEDFETCAETKLAVGETLGLNSGMTITVLRDDSPSGSCAIEAAEYEVQPWGRRTFISNHDVDVRFDLGGQAQYLQWVWTCGLHVTLTLKFYDESDNFIGESTFTQPALSYENGSFTAPTGQTFTYFIMTYESKVTAVLLDDFVWGFEDSTI